MLGVSDARLLKSELVSIYGPFRSSYPRHAVRSSSKSFATCAKVSSPALHHPAAVDLHVYLHPEDMARLRGILPASSMRARRALDAEVSRSTGRRSPRS